MSLPTTYDDLFDKYRGNIPKAYLRALVYQESHMNPRAHEPPGGRGLMQITGIAREDHNRIYKTGYTAADLFKPEVSILIGAKLLQRIVAGYAKHPDPNMREDWNNAEFAKLVTMGWNAGHSEGGGVGRVASYLESRGLRVTHDNVQKYAAAAGAVAKLGNTKARNWQRGVVALFRRQPDWKNAASGVATLLLVLGVGWAALRFKIFS